VSDRQGAALHSAAVGIGERDEAASSGANVAVVRAHIEAFGQDVPRALALLDSSVVLDMSRGPSLDTEPAYGPDGVAEAMRRYVGAFEDYSFEAERLTDLGSGAVLAVVTETGRGKTSGAPVRRSYAVLYGLLDGRITRITLFASEDDALAAIAPD
jgi:ketosteroid isomerase-like protein